MMNYTYRKANSKVEVVVGAGSRGAGQGSGDAGAVMRNLSDPSGQPSPAFALLTNTLLAYTTMRRLSSSMTRYTKFSRI